MFRAAVLSSIIWALMSIWSKLVRISFVNRDIPDRLKTDGKNFIYAFWHGNLFFLTHSHRNTGVMIPASESRDGEILARILRGFGYVVVRGSSKRKGDRALLGMIEGLRKGKTVAIAVDGPRGPLHEVKKGIVYLAGKLNKPIVPVSASAKRFWVLEKTWEKLMLPLPLTRAVVIYGEPISVHGTSDEEIDAKRKEIESALHGITREADAYFKIQNPKSEIRN